MHSGSRRLTHVLGLSGGNLVSRIDQFNHACSLIFNQLYDAFPVPIDIQDNSLGFFAKNDPSNEPREILSATFVFLADEGYIIYDRASDQKAVKYDVRLTSKGLARLQRIPHGVRPLTKPIIDQLKEALTSVGRNASSSAIAGATKQVLSLIFGGQA